MRGHGEKRRPDDRSENGIGRLQHLLECLAEWSRGIPSGLKHACPRIRREAGRDRFPSAGDGKKDCTHREKDRADHETCLDEVSPNHCLDTANRGVDGRHHGGEENPPEIGTQGDRCAGIKIPPNNDDNHTAEIKTHADAEHAGYEKNSAGHVARARTEPQVEEFVNALDLVAVVGRNEKVGDEKTRDDRADCQLRVGEAARFEALGRCPEKSGGAGLRRDNRGQYGPPRNLVPPEGEFLETVAAPPGAQTDADNHGEIDRHHHGVDHESRIHK